MLTFTTDFLKEKSMHPTTSASNFLTTTYMVSSCSVRFCPTLPCGFPLNVLITSGASALSPCPSRRFCGFAALTLLQRWAGETAYPSFSGSNFLLSFHCK